MNAADRKFVDVGGVRTCYYEKGSGPPVVLFHGGNFGSPDLADSALDWDTIFDQLAARCHVIAVDKLGQGRTDIPRRDEDYAMAAVVRHAAATLDALGLKAAHLVGHSRGGYLTCRMTLERPDLARSCTIVDSNTCAPGISLNDIVFANPPEPRLTRESLRWVAERYSFSPAHVTEDWLDDMVTIAAGESYRAAVRKMEDEGLKVRLFLPALARDKIEMFGWIRDRGMKRPTQLIWGYNDPTATMDHARALYDLIAGRERRAQLHVINQAGHFSYREHPAAFIGCLMAFIAGTVG
jgi:pimeloyl-ACP methyl ester carboxylesterase